MAKLINQLGIEGYVNSADLVLKTSWTTVSTLSINAYVALGLPNEKWLTLTSTNRYLQHEINPEVLPDSSVELEIHWTMIPTTVSAADRGPLRLYGFDSGEFNVGIDANNNFSLVVPSTGTLTQESGFSENIVNVDQLYFCVYRIKSETSAGNDGKIELWVNDDLHSTYTGVSTGSLSTVLTDNLVSWGRSAGPTSLGYRARNFVIYDGFSSTFGTKPQLLNVLDLELNTVTGLDYEIIGGAASELLALEDTSTATYIQTLVEDAAVAIDFAIDPSFAATDVVGVAMNVATSRVTVAPNNNTVLEVLNDGTVAQSETVVINTLGTAREYHTITDLPSTATTVDKLKLNIKNGNA